MDIQHKHFSPPQFDTPQEFWCSVCDNIQVKSDNEKSGKFFSVCGHVYYRGEVKDKWPMVVFAICSHCLENA